MRAAALVCQIYLLSYIYSNPYKACTQREVKQNHFMLLRGKHSGNLFKNYIELSDKQLLNFVYYYKYRLSSCTKYG